VPGTFSIALSPHPFIQLSKNKLTSRQPPDLPPTAISPLPDFLLKSPLRSKITQRILQPHTQLSTFFFRRSVEKAFQLDESPASQLSLNPSNPLPPTLSQPYVISAVDDVMYIVSTVLSRAISTQQQEVISGVVPAVGRVLGADFVGCVQRRMRDESYPRAAVAGGLPSEAVIIQFIVLINSLDVSNEYMGRIVAQHLTPATEVNGNGTANGGAAPVDPFLKTQLEGLKTSFEHKLSELRTEALTLLFHNVVKLRLRSIISDTFRDAVADYSLSPAQLSQLAQDMEMSADDDAFLDIVERKFESGWAALMGPLRRIMTPGTYAALLSATAEYLSKVLEKKVWSWEGKCSPTGAVRLERDVSAVVNVVCKGSYGLKGRWFERVGQVGMVANLEEEEWEVMRGGDGGEEAGVTWVLSREERERARRLVRV
jgi:hypothetical protein